MRKSFSLTEKRGPAAATKRTKGGRVGNVSAKFCRCHVFCVCICVCVSGRFRFQCRQQQWEERGQRRATVHQLDLWFPVFFLSFFKSGLSWDNAHGGTMRLEEGEATQLACLIVELGMQKARKKKKTEDLSESRSSLRSAERGAAVGLGVGIKWNAMSEI